MTHMPWNGTERLLSAVRLKDCLRGQVLVRNRLCRHLEDTALIVRSEPFHKFLSFLSSDFERLALRGPGGGKLALDDKVRLTGWSAYTARVQDLERYALLAGRGVIIHSFICLAGSCALHVEKFV